MQARLAAVTFIADAAQQFDAFFEFAATAIHQRHEGQQALALHGQHFAGGNLPQPNQPEPQPDAEVAPIHTDQARRRFRQSVSRQQQHITRNRALIFQPQPQGVIGHAVRHGGFPVSLRFDVGNLFAVGATDPKRLIGQRGRHADFARQQFDVGLFAGFECAEQDQQRFSVLLDQILEGLVIRFGVHG